MARILVEINVGKGKASDYMKMIEDNKESFFPVGQGFISVNKTHMIDNPMNEDAYLFKLAGVLDIED